VLKQARVSCKPQQRAKCSQKVKVSNLIASLALVERRGMQTVTSEAVERVFELLLSIVPFAPSRMECRLLRCLNSRRDNDNLLIMMFL